MRERYEGFSRLRERLRMALYEDLGEIGDLTTDAIFTEHDRAEAQIVAKQQGVVAGVHVVEILFEEHDPNVRIELLREDGDRVKPGDLVICLEGPTRSLLSGERTALNFLQKMSGIATITARFVEESGGKVSICDTRKTTPLWRDLDKLAVSCGGGTNHRFGLYDMLMIKDTHSDGAGGLRHALGRIQHLRPEMHVAAEARNMDEVRAAKEAKVDLIMLDNMNAEQMREALLFINNEIPVEATGGVTLDTVAHFADLGVDRISIGLLTHSHPALDFSMRIHMVKPKPAKDQTEHAGQHTAG